MVKTRLRNNHKKSTTCPRPHVEAPLISPLHRRAVATMTTAVDNVFEERFSLPWWFVGKMEQISISIPLLGLLMWKKV